jgi:hypothetical protein
MLELNQYVVRDMVVSYLRLAEVQSGVYRI